MHSSLFILPLFLSIVWANNCSSWTSCVTCVPHATVDCNWCQSTKLCFNTNEYTCTSDQISSADACPTKSITNVGTHYVSWLVPMYLVLLAAVVIIHYLRVHAIEPIIDFHVNRRTVMDFSALLDPKIDDIVNSALPSSEQLIWADVSLKISRWRHLLPSVVCFVIGGVVISALPHIPSAAPYLLPLFILLTVPCIMKIASGLHQLIKKKHYTHVYLLTTSGAIIVREGFRRTEIFQWPYRFMVNIHSEHVMYKVASVYFAESWDIAGSVPINRDTRKTDPSPFSRFKWKKSRVGFENIVKANEVEDLIRQQVTQLSPSSPRNVAYTL